MRGRLVYVMGPSGAGKDSLLDALRQTFCGWPVAFPRRYITRPASAGGERHIPVSPEYFKSLEEQGYFSLHWASHGYLYGIAASTDTALACGVSLIVNGSRAAFPQALRRYPDLLPVLVTVPAAALRERLVKRGRESGEALEERLRAAFMPIPGEDSASDWIRLDNSGPLEQNARELTEKLSGILGLR